VLVQLGDEDAGSTGSAAGVSRLLGIFRGSSYTSSATEACRSTLNAVRILRRTRRSTSDHCFVGGSHALF
jgi:hypothetical protein